MRAFLVYIFVLLACVIVGIVGGTYQVAADWRVKSDVDLYKEPGGEGKPIGIVRGSKTKTYPTITCRSDNWCQIPGKGWVWGDFVEEVEGKPAPAKAEPKVCGSVPRDLDPTDPDPTEAFRAQHPECGATVSCTPLECCCTPK